MALVRSLLDLIGAASVEWSCKWAIPSQLQLHVARVKVSRLFLFGAARVPAGCALSALPQQNIV